MYPTAKINGKV